MVAENRRPGRLQSSEAHVPNTTMIRTTQVSTDHDDSGEGAGPAPAAPELPLTAALVDGRAHQSGQGAGADPDSEWLLERLLTMGMPDLLYLPVQPGSAT